MVGVADTGGGGGGGNGGGVVAAQAHEPYYGEYYYMPPEMCPTHQICTIPSEYGGVSMPVVPGGVMMPHVLDESGNVRQYVMTHPPPPHHPPPQHHQPHHYGPVNGSGPPQQFYPGPGSFAPPNYHQPPPLRQHHVPHSPPPPPHLYHKDERTQKQHTKLKRKLEQKQNSQQRNNGFEIISGSSTPSPRKDMVNGSGSSGNGSSAACWSEGESSSATASIQDQDDNTQSLLDMLSAARSPHVTEITPVSALVQWNTPLPPGLTLPKGELTYELLLGDKGRYKAIYRGQSLSCRVRDLRPGTEYSVCLQVRCGTVLSSASDSKTFRAPAAPPGPPAAPRLTPRARFQLLLKWAAAPERGSKIVHYVVEMDVGAGWTEIGRPRARQLVATDLRPVTYHRFRVAAVNECGQGVWSEEVGAWTAGAPPPAPPAPRIVAVKSNAVTIEWEPAPPTDEFTLQMAEECNAHGFRPVYSGSETRYICEGLRRATLYRFRLRRESPDGVGPWSSETTTRTTPERPSPPGRPMAKGKIHSRAFRLRWDPPSDDGGAPITSYALELDEGSGYDPVYSGLEREANCERLRPGGKYRARVNCTTAGGTSEWAQSDTITTEAVTPSHCRAPELASEAKSRSATVRWKPPDCDGGAEVVLYRLEASEIDGAPKIVYEGTDLHFNIHDLEPGHDYEVSVIPCNKVGAGQPSPKLRFTTAPAPPDAPEPPIVENISPYSACVRWKEPNGNGAPVTEYHLERSQVNSDAAYLEIYHGPCLEAKASLTPFTPYSFRVCARGPAGRGLPSSPTAILSPPAPPAAPLALRHQPTANSIRLLWDQPEEHGSSIIKYIIEVDDAKYETSEAETEYTLENLRPDTMYGVKVTAVNELGAGDPAVAQLPTRPPPPAPPKLECIQRAHNFLKIQWGDGVVSEEVQFRLEMRGPDSRDFRIAYRGPQHFFKAKKLRESATYRFRISATDERGGRGEFSEPYDFATCAAPPPPPRSFVAEPTESRCVSLSWEPHTDLEYIVQFWRARDVQPQTLRTVVGAPGTRLDDLEAGAEYWFRVCGVRANLQGPWSTALRVTVPVPNTAAPTRSRRTRAAPRLAERHAALIIAAAFVLVAVLVAVGVERFVNSRGP